MHEPAILYTLGIKFNLFYSDCSLQLDFSGKYDVICCSHVYNCKETINHAVPLTEHIVYTIHSVHVDLCSWFQHQVVLRKSDI